MIKVEGKAYELMHLCSFAAIPANDTKGALQANSFRYFFNCSATYELMRLCSFVGARPFEASSARRGRLHRCWRASQAHRVGGRVPAEGGVEDDLHECPTFSCFTVSGRVWVRVVATSTALDLPLVLHVLLFFCVGDYESWMSCPQGCLFPTRLSLYLALLIYEASHYLLVVVA